MKYTGHHIDSAVWLNSMEARKQPLANLSNSMSWEGFEAQGSGMDLVMTLRKEVERERTYNLQLSLELAEERLKLTELETLLGISIPSTSLPIPSPLSPPYIGAYPPSIRREKILKYKTKLRHHREKMNVSRVFPGRSGVARQKPRVQGRFVKQDAAN